MKQAKVKPKYEAILKLYEYCQRIGIEAELTTLYDGYKLTFPSGGDIVQHEHSYRSEFCVEPAIGSRYDYKPYTVDEAKRIVEKHKDRLNRRANDENC